MTASGNKRNILFITGTRADFGKLKSLMRAVESEPDFDCSIFVTGMHLLKKYGNTIQEIRKEKFRNIFPYFNQTDATSKFMDKVLAETINGLSRYVSENHVDLLVVHGDRVEALAGAIVGALQGIRTAHIEGGERSGTVDELIRHSVSKLAHIHFVATAKNMERLVQMGENKENIFIIGSPDIDIMLNENMPPIDEVKNFYDIHFDEYGVFTYHPVVTELDKLKYNINEVVEGLKLSGKNFVVVYPNNDTGTEIIVEKIEELKGDKHFRIFPSIRFENYLTLIKNARCVVGNSSCGIHEAPVYGVPTINIGTRQNKRFNSESIINIPEHRQILANTINNIPKKFTPSLTYGKGNSSRLFMEILKKEDIWQASLQKFFFDLK